MASARAVEITDEGSFIPASQRPDGSWRKARRVKEGYVPQEEVPLYESKGKQWANSHHRQYPVGMNPADIKAKEEAKLAAARSCIPGLIVVNEGKKKKKKKKSGEKEVTIDTPQDGKTVVGGNSSEPVEEWHTVHSKSAKTSKVEAVVPFDPSKRLKNLKKKLREIEAIEEKIASDEIIKKPDKDQVEKVHKKADVLSEILALELSLNK